MTPNDPSPIRKCYVRFRDGHPDGDAQAYAYQGLRALGVEVVGYDWIDDIQGFGDLGPDVGVAGYVGDVHAALTKIGRPIPDANDYPECLRDVLFRKVEKMTLVEATHLAECRFIKPVDLKVFPGFIFVGHWDAMARTRLRDVPEDTLVWSSEVVDFVAEFRAFVLHRKILDVRRYKGDWGQAPSRAVIEDAVKRMGRHAPHAYCLDFGIMIQQRAPFSGTPLVEIRPPAPFIGTALIEYNHAYSLGHYGLAPVSYARMIAARWRQLAGGATNSSESAA